MDKINDLERMIAEWYESAPHLPSQGRTWLAKNMWWITLVGIILMGLGALSILMGTFFASVAITAYGGVAGAAASGVIILAAISVIAFMAIAVVLGAMAIAPLKAMRHKGWTLLFIIMIVDVIQQFVVFVFNFSLFGLIWGLLFTAIGGYFLFEIRDFYTKSAPKTKTHTPEVDAK